MNKEYKYKITKFADRYQMTINNMTLYDVDEYVVKIIKQSEQENTNLKQALIDIREFMNKDAILGKKENGEPYYLKDDECGKDILQIIDKVLGDDDNENS